jgi:hypothetical protein
MNSLLNKIKLIETTKLNTMVPNYGPGAFAPICCTQQIALIAKLFTDTLKGTHKQVSQTGHGLWIPAIKKP